MPTAIITAIMFVGNLVMTALPMIEVVFGIGAGTMFITGALAITAGVVGMSKLMEMSIPRPDSNYARQKTVRSTTAPVKRVYGESLISGPVAFMGVGGAGNQDLWHVIALTGDKSEAITDIYLDNIIIPNADINNGNALGGVVNGTTTVFRPTDSTNLVTVYKYTGGQTAASQPVVSEFFKWTGDHEGQGLTYIATKFSFPDNEKIAEVWNKYNPQDIKALVKGMAIYDPRKDSTSPEYDSSLGVSTQRLSDSTTWQWSDNPALCLANYVIDNQFGMGVPSSSMDWASVHSAADYSDALVSIPGSQTQKRFTCNGVLYGTDTHAQNINKILSSMNGSLVYSSGKYLMQAGQYIAPESDAILTDDDLNGPINITIASTRDDRFNTIKGTHFNPEDLHKKVAFPEVQLTDIATRDAGEVLYKEVELPMTNDVYMCQRLTYQMINRSNDQMVIEFPCNLKALRYTVGDRVKITLDKFAGSSQDSISFNETPFVVLGFNFSAEGAVTLTLLKDTQANYTDMPAGNYSTIASDGSITDGFSGVPAPTNLGSVVDQHFVRLTWDNPVPNTTFNDIIVYQSATSNFTDSSIFLRTKNDAITFSLPTSALTRYYWVRASLYDNEVDATDIIIGQTYRIRSLGTTSWTTLGATAPVSNGDTFLATASGTSSSGTGVATDESAVSAVVGPETVTTTDQVADSVEWIDVDNADGRRPSDNATVGATLGTNVYDGQAQAYAVGDLLNSNGFFRFTRTSADDNVDAPADAAAFNTAFGRNPTDGDIVVVTNTTSSPNKQAAYQYNGSTFGTISGFFAGDLIIDDTITAAALSVDELGAITADLGTITGGTLKGGGATAPPDADAAPSGSESGSFFDLTGGKFVVGDATGNILFDGSSLSVTGAITATSGTFDGTVNASAGVFSGQVAVGSTAGTITVIDGNDTDYRMFTNATLDTETNQYLPDDSSFKVGNDGRVFASNITIYNTDGDVLLSPTGLGVAALNDISLSSGSVVSTVGGTVNNSTSEITLTTATASESFSIASKVALNDNYDATQYFSGASTISTASAEAQLTGVDVVVDYYVKPNGGSYSGTPSASQRVTVVNSGTPTSTQMRVGGFDRGSGYSGSLTRYFAVLQDFGGALEIIPNSGGGATSYVVTTAALGASLFPTAQTYKIKIVVRVVEDGTNTVISGSTTPPSSNNTTTGIYFDGGNSDERHYEITGSGLIKSSDNVFISGSQNLLSSGGTISGNLVVTGDLTVQGTTTTINVADLTVADKDITLNYSTGDSSSTANNAGIVIQDAVSASTDASLLWKTASDTFEFSHGVVTPTLVSGNIDIGDGTAREELKIKSNSYAEVHYFIKHANNSNVLTEYIRAGVSLTEASYNQVIGDYFLFSVPQSKMLLTVPVNGDPLRRNNGAITIIDSTNYGTYALPLAGGTLSGNLLTTGTLQFDVGTGLDKSNIIQAANFPSESFSASTQKYWIEYKAKGGHHFVVNTDGGSTGAENTFDHFTIWQGAIDGMQLLRVTNVGNATFAGAVSGASFELSGISVIDSSQNINAASISTSAIASTGDITLTSTTTSSPSVKFNSSTATDPAVDMAIKLVGEELHFYEPDDSDKVHFKILDDTGVDAPFGYWVNGTRMADASRNLTVGTIGSGAITSTAGLSGTTGTFSGTVYAGTRVEIEGGAAWAYTRLQDTGGVKWDIAANANDNSSALQFRPFGTGTNATLMSTAGNWTIAGTVSSGAITSSGVITSTLQGNNFVMDGHADAKGLVMTPDSSTTYPVFLKSLNPASGEASPWIYREQVEEWGILHNNPINSFDFTRSYDSGYALIGADVGGGTNSVMHRFNTTNGDVHHHGDAYIGEKLFFGVSGSSSFISRDSTVNLGLYADGAHKFYTYTDAWTEQATIDDSGLTVLGQITVTNDDHNYLKIESALDREQMVRFKNSLSNYWYAGLRTSAGLSTTAGFHVYSTAYGNDVLGLKTDGSIVVAAGATFGGGITATTGTFSGAVNGVNLASSASGSRWGVTAEVASNGVMEVGRYVDFHATNADTADYGARLDFDGTDLVIVANAKFTGNILQDGFLRVAAGDKSRFGGDTYSSTTGMYDNVSSAFQHPVLVIRKDATQAGALNTAPVSMFIHNGVGKWVKLSLGARETNSAGNTVSVAGIASERTAGTSGAWATGNLHLWTKSASSQITNMILKSDGDSEIPAGSLSVLNNYKVNGTTVIDSSRNFIGQNVEARNGINLRRDLSPATGISFYTPTYYNWQVYMAAAGAIGCGPNANLTAPYGLAGVTSWALRSRMEGVATYGWIWETGASGGGGATATAKMSLQSTTGNLQIAGTFTSGSNITAYSDERLKQNIETLDGSKVLAMRGVSFTKDGEAGSGVIAQELELIAPELVHDDGTYKSVAYGNIVGYLIENAKQQQAEIDELKALVKLLMEK